MTVKSKLWYRLRGLDQMESRFGTNKIQKFIKERLETQKKVRVLELGFGEGKVLIELRAMFPDGQVELYGINDVKKGNMSGRNDFLANAKLFKIKIPRTNLPKPYFYDAGEGLKFKSDFFDVIISQVAFHYVGDKAKLVEEFWRVLRYGGKCFVNIDSFGTFRKFPDFLKTSKKTPRWIIYKNGRVMSLSLYLAKIRKKGYDIKISIGKDKPGQPNILMVKNKKKALELGLKFDRVSTFNLTKLYNADPTKIGENGWWGSRSVYFAK